MNIHYSNVMLCIRCVQKVVVYSELLTPGQAITWDRYQQQTTRGNKSRIESKTTGICQKTRQSDFPALQRLTCLNNGEGNS